MKLQVRFDIGDKVLMDECGDIIGIILSISVRGTGFNVTYDVAWFHNGAQQSAWIEEWRLEPWVE